MDRARAIVQQMIKTGQRILQTMDGQIHYCFLAALLEANLNMDDFDITLYDNTPAVHRWHQLTMPSNGEDANVENHFGDILFYPVDQAERDYFHENTLVYYNFCSLGAQVLNLQTQLQWFLDDRATVFISWSIRRVKPGSDAYDFGSWVKKNGEYVSYRPPNFVTYRLAPSSR